VGLLHTHHAGRNYGLLRGCLVAQFPQYLRHAAFSIGVRRRPCPFKYINEHNRPCRDDIYCGSVLQIIIFNLRIDDHTVFTGAVSLWYIARYFRERFGAAFRPGIGMVHLAASGADVPVCRGPVSSFDTPAMDAIHCASPAAVIRVRRTKGNSLGRRFLRNYPRMGRLPCRRIYSFDVLVFYKSLPACSPHRPHSPLQRRKRGLDSSRRLNVGYLLLPPPRHFFGTFSLLSLSNMIEPP